MRTIGNTGVDIDTVFDDMDSEHSILIFRLTTEERRRLLTGILERYDHGEEPADPREAELSKLLHPFRDLAHPIKDLDLTLDPVLGEYLQGLVHVPHEGFMSNFLNQDFLPHPEYFNLAYKKYPASADPNVAFNIDTKEGKIEIPASVFYFGLLRKAV